MPKVNWEKKSVAELKAYLKDAGMSGSGDKGTLVWRIGLNEKVDTHKLVVLDGKKPTQLKPAELKKCCACAGLSPIGSNDELLSSLVDHLASKSLAPVASASSSSTADSGSPVRSGEGEANQKPSGVALAKKILLLDESDDYAGILNLLGGHGEGRITKTSPVAVMRKAYLKLSLQIHPDKLSRVFDQATKAFQALVRALERLSQPELLDDPPAAASRGRGAGKVAAISRSNEGCFRTRVCCPRCKQPWSEGSLDGNPEYFYNFLMMGLKCFSCSTCLCEFGAVTAIHQCPLCRDSFDYSPQDYHRKISCGNARCTREFGFHLYHVSDRVMTEMKKSVRMEQEHQAKLQRTKQRRAEGRAGRSEHLSAEEEERAFVMGLADCCPRCGEFFETYRRDGEAQQLHLLQCGDGHKHAAHQAQKERAEERKLAGQKRAAKQHEAQSLAQWEFLGAKSSQLYLLSDAQLQVVAEREGAAQGGALSSSTQEDLVRRIAASRREAAADAVQGTARKRIKAADSGVSNPNLALTLVADRVRLAPDDLPGNMYGMALRELKLFCASQGLQLPKGASKAEVIEEIERATDSVD